MKTKNIDILVNFIATVPADLATETIYVELPQGHVIVKSADPDFSVTCSNFYTDEIIVQNQL